MITGSSSTGSIWEKRIRWYRWVIPLVHVSDNKIKNLLTAGDVVDQLAKLGRKVENDIRLIAIEVTKEGKLSLGIFHLE